MFRNSLYQWIYFWFFLNQFWKDCYQLKSEVKVLRDWRDFFCKACQNFANCFKSGQPSSHQRLFQNFRCHFIQFKFFRSLGHNRISWISTLLKASQKYCLSFENKITYCALCICVKSEMCGDDGFTAHFDLIWFIQKLKVLPVSRTLQVVGGGGSLIIASIGGEAV